MKIILYAKDEGSPEMIPGVKTIEVLTAGHPSLGIYFLDYNKPSRFVLLSNIAGFLAI
jgi:hypothetical protein